MLQINFNPFPVIETERLVLRRIQAQDVAEIFFLRSNEDVMRYIDRPRATTEPEALAMIEKFWKLEQDNEGINWAISLKDDDKLIGTICLFNFVKEHYRGELGYLLHPEHHGKGLMQEAVKPVLDYGFKQLQLHTIEANVNPDNEASIKVLERNNFVREAYFKENYFYNGKFMDTAVYSLITPY
jgi:[ribosomal protein S5]-alanine N-acetyltransferase